MILDTSWKSHHFYKSPIVEVITNKRELDAFYQKVKGKDISFDLETKGVQWWSKESEILCFSFSIEPGRAFIVPIHSQGLVPYWKDKDLFNYVYEVVQQILGDPSTTKIGHNIKFDVNYCRSRDIDVKGPWFDTMVGFSLCDENAPNDLLTVADYYGLDYGKWDDQLRTFVSKKNPDYSKVPDNVLWQYSGTDAVATFELRSRITKHMLREEVYSVFTDISLPLLEPVSEMEYQGVKIDTRLVNAFSKGYKTKTEKKLKQIRELTGDPDFNPNSPTQLAKKLSESLKGGKKTTTGRMATDEEVLKRLAKDGNTLCQLVLDLRGLVKIRSTYMTGFLDLADDKGYIHTNYSIAHTVTGRLNSRNPNLQNIPRMREKGAPIRSFFVAPEGSVLINADYAQMEQRVIGFLSKDKELLNIFERGEDIHLMFTSLALKKDPKEITKEERAHGKMIIFGSNYGQSPETLAKEYDIPVKDAAFLMDRYFTVFPDMYKWRLLQHTNAKNTHLLKTSFGRKRRFVGYDFLKSGYATDIQQKYEIKAIYINMRNMSFNFRIQSTSSDYLSLATIKIYKTFKERNMKSYICFSVHDAIVISAPKEEEEDAKKIIKDCMDRTLRDKEGNWVNLIADVKVGKRWVEIPRLKKVVGMAESEATKCT